jgi:adenylosuccinate lyase
MPRALKPLVLPAVSMERQYSAIDPLDSRYYDPEIALYLSEQSRIMYQAHVEAALASALADFGVCSQKIASEIDTASRKITIEDVYAEEQTTKHDIKAIVNCIKVQVSPAAQPFVHFGATSYDIISTAAALQLRGAMEHVVLPRLKTLVITLIEMSDTYSDTVQIGRTHGQHAVPITFGYALSEYVMRLGENYEALRDLSHMLKGKFSGAVGAYNALSIFIDDPIKFEAAVLDMLGLKPAAYATQIVPAEGTVRLLDELAISANIMANLSHDMRHLQRTEIGEVRERFEKGQTGSSTMAHKRNPWNFENVVSMSKQVTAQLINANLNLSSEHQRDLTDSASSRFYAIMPASVASMAKRLNTIMSKLEVDEANMHRNLLMTGGAIAAEPLYLLFEKHGHVAAHEKSKDLAHMALKSGQSLIDVIKQDEEAKKYWEKFSLSEQLIIQSPEKHYTGLSAQKSKALSSEWRSRMQRS